MTLTYYVSLAVLLIQINEVVAFLMRTSQPAMNMSVETAIHVVTTQMDAPSHLVAFIQEQLQHNGGSLHHRGGKHLRHNHGRHRTHKHPRRLEHRQIYSHLAKHSRAQRQSPGGQQEADAKTMLNSMLEKLDKEKTMEQVKCAQFEKTSNTLLERMRQDVSAYNAQSADAEAEILRTSSAIEVAKTKGATTKDSLAAHREKCLNDKAAMRSEAIVTGQDIATMTRVLQATTCDIAQTVGLLQCAHPDGGKAFVAVNHSVISAHLAHLQSSVARQSLQQGLAALSRDASGTQEAAQQEPQDTSADDGVASIQDPNNISVVTAPPVTYESVMRKCTMNSNPTCGQMRMKFLGIQARIAEKKEQLNSQLVAYGHECESMADTFTAEINNLEARLREEETNLAYATKLKSQAEEMSRLKNLEASKLQKDYGKGAKHCEDNLGNYDNQMCGVMKIRSELSAMDGGSSTQDIQDCQESDWVEEECSLTCGGGTQKLTRTVIVHPNGGRPCGPLEMARQCNEVPCPTDCELNDWGGWSSCTASCGQGVRTRMREVKESPAFGGKPCPQRQETEACNVQACDADCTLGDWSPFSGCDKMCNTGFQTRTRGVAQAAVGSGDCPDLESEDRTEFMPCNTDSCETLAAENDNGILQCQSKADIVLVLDGSEKLTMQGWNAMKEAGATFVNAMEGGPDKVQVGALLYASPPNWESYDQCIHEDVEGLTPESCGVTWVSHLTDSTSQVASLIHNAEMKEGGQMTATALAMAGAEMQHGRADAQSIVLVITDSAPESPTAVHQIVKRLREKGTRLVFVPVSYRAPVNVYEQWASMPVHENVLNVLDFESLGATETMNDLISNVCSVVSR